MPTGNLRLQQLGSIFPRWVRDGEPLRTRLGVHPSLVKWYMKLKSGFWRMGLITPDLGNLLLMLILRKEGNRNSRLGGECGGHEYCTWSSEIQWYPLSFE